MASHGSAKLPSGPQILCYFMIWYLLRDLGTIGNRNFSIAFCVSSKEKTIEKIRTQNALKNCYQRFLRPGDDKSNKFHGKMARPGRNRFMWRAKGKYLLGAPIKESCLSIKSHRKYIRKMTDRILGHAGPRFFSLFLLLISSGPA